MASSSRKRKRPSDDSFRKNFRELRDAGVLDTGPKRPANKKTVSLTPVAAANTGPVRRSERVEKESGRKRGKSSSSGDSRRRSVGEPTPRTRLRQNIRDLINSAVEKGDVTPAPSRTVLTPHIQPGPQRDLEKEVEEEDAVANESVDDDDTVEAGRGRETDIIFPESDLPITPGTRDAALEEDATPSQDSRMPQSVLKGIHSFLSLRKKSLLSRTPHSVTFTDNITINEYSPVKGSDFTMDSSASSLSSSVTPSPLSSYNHQTNISQGGDDDGQMEPLEPLEGEDEEGEADGIEVEEEEEEEEEGEELEEEEAENGVHMKTPHLPAKPPSPSSRKKTKTPRLTKAQRTTSKKARKPRKSSTIKKDGAKTLSRTLLKNLFMLSARRRLTKDAAALVVKFSEVYLKRCSEDLAQYASHAGRKTVEVDDAILLMTRQRFITEREPFEYLVHSHLPMEYVEELLPCAVAGKKIVPSHMK